MVLLWELVSKLKEKFPNNKNIEFFADYEATFHYLGIEIDIRTTYEEVAELIKSTSTLVWIGLEVTWGVASKQEMLGKIRELYSDSEFTDYLIKLKNTC